MKPVSNNQNNPGVHTPPERSQDGSHGNNKPPSNSGWGPVIPMFGDGPPQIYNIVQVNQINQNQFFSFFGGNPNGQTGPTGNNGTMPPSGNQMPPGTQNSPFNTNMPNTNGAFGPQNTGNFMAMPGNTPGVPNGTGMPSMGGGQNDAVSQQLTSVCIMLIQFIQKMVTSLMEQRSAESTSNTNNETDPSKGCKKCDDDPSVDGPDKTDGTDNEGGDDESVPDNLKEIDKKYGDIVDKAVKEANSKHPGAHITRNYVLATIMRESSGDPNAVGDGGTSLGLMQLNDVHGLSREDRFDPETSIRFATDLMAGYSAKYHGDVRQTAMAYMTGDDNNGPYGDMAREYADSIVDMMNG